MDYETFEELYTRELRSNDNGADLITLFRLSVADEPGRHLLQIEDQARGAIIVGKILDRIDSVVQQSNTGCFNKLVEWREKQDAPREIYILFNNEDFKPIKELCKANQSRIELSAFSRIASDLRANTKLFEKLAEVIDCEMEDLTISALEKREKTKSIANAEIVSYYKKQGFIPKDARIRGATKKAEEIIDNKMKTGLRLKPIEINYCRYRGYFLIFRKPVIESGITVNNISKARNHRIFSLS